MPELTYRRRRFVLTAMTGIIISAATTMAGPGRRPTADDEPVRTDVSATTPTKPEDAPAVFDAFAAWLNHYLAQSSADRRVRLDPEGERLALRRRSALHGLIRSDPAEALRRAIPHSIVSRLPDRIARHLEEHISAGALFIVTHGCGPDGQAVFREAACLGRTYNAFVYGRGAEQTTRRDMHIEGIAVDHDMAIDEKCLAGPVPMRAQLPPALERVRTRFGEGLRRPWTTGVKTVLYLRLDYSDAPGGTLGIETVQAFMAQSEGFYAENTYGRIPSMPVTITPVLRMLMPSSSYQSRAQVEQDATIVALAAGFDPSQFDLVVYQNTPTQVMSGFTGFARENAAGIWIAPQASGWILHAHEIGHNFGNRHANFWDTPGKSPISGGENVEYGDIFDNMGGQFCSSWGSPGHHNPWFKNRQDWIDDADIATVTASGSFRVQALEDAPAGDWMALKIPRDASRNYWVYHRRQFGATENGAMVAWGYNRRVSEHLLDMTPGTATAACDDVQDAALPIGQSFFDWAANIRITVPAPAGPDPGTLDIQIDRGPPNNFAPTVNAGPNQVLTFTGASVTANLAGIVTDPDDVPAVQWQTEAPVVFGDPGSAQTTVTLTQPGFLELTLSADDGVNPPVADGTFVLVVSPGAQGLLINAPEGNEVWTEGQSATVTWSAAGIPNLAIELSRDGGTNWEMLAAAVPASAGTWTWAAVTGPGSNRCLIRLSDADDGFPATQSQDFFSISAPVCAPTIPGDLDGDGDVDLADATLLEEALLEMNSDPCVAARADLTGNGSADGGDLQPFLGALLP